MKRTIAIGLTACAAWLTLVGAGCHLFRPDDPEPPSGTPIIPDYSTPDRTLDMIAQAIQDKARNNGSSIYIDAFSDTTGPGGRTYRQFFWQTDLDESGATPPAEWGIVHEGKFYSNFINLRGDEYRLTWEEDQQHPDNQRLEEGWAEVHRHYEVITETENGAITGSIAFGFADLYMTKGSDGRWRIVTWNDRVDPAGDPGAEEVTLGRRRLTTQ